MNGFNPAIASDILRARRRPIRIPEGPPTPKAELIFRVHGLPVPQGSTRAFLVKGRPVVTHDSPKVRPWRQDVAAMARAAGARILEGPVSLGVTFLLPHPKSRARATHHSVRPDLDKLIRAILDALTGIAWHDDGQVAAILAVKTYAGEAEPPGAHIVLKAMSGPLPRPA